MTPRSTPGSTIKRQRLGVFGGAFDPPHVAHVALAKVAIHQLELDGLWVIPTGQAWHKTRALSPAVHRLKMAALAFAFEPRIVIDDRETRRAGPTYTIETLRELQAENPRADLFLIVGADQARSLNQWHQWEDVVKSATICVAGREHSASADGEFVPPPALKGRFAGLMMPFNPVSATAIRTRVAQSEPVAALVGESVARYIAQHHLYLQS